MYGINVFPCNVLDESETSVTILFTFVILVVFDIEDRNMADGNKEDVWK